MDFQNIAKPFKGTSAGSCSSQTPGLYAGSMAVKLRRDIADDFEGPSTMLHSLDRNAGWSLRKAALICRFSHRNSVTFTFIHQSQRSSVLLQWTNGIQARYSQISLPALHPIILPSTSRPRGQCIVGKATADTVYTTVRRLWQEGHAGKCSSSADEVQRLHSIAVSGLVTGGKRDESCSETGAVQRGRYSPNTQRQTLGRQKNDCQGLECFSRK